jgi:hypothetical protein
MTHFLRRNFTLIELGGFGVSLLCLALAGVSQFCMVPQIRPENRLLPLGFLFCCISYGAGSVACWAERVRLSMVKTIAIGIFIASCLAGNFTMVQ